MCVLVSPLCAFQSDWRASHSAQVSGILLSALTAHLCTAWPNLTNQTLKDEKEDTYQDEPAFSNPLCFVILVAYVGSCLIHFVSVRLGMLTRSKETPSGLTKLLNEEKSFFLSVFKLKELHKSSLTSALAGK